MKPKRQGPSLASFVNNRSSTYTGFQAKKLREKQQNSKKINKYRKLLKHLGNDKAGRRNSREEADEDPLPEQDAAGAPDEPRAPENDACLDQQRRSGKSKSKSRVPLEHSVAGRQRLDGDSTEPELVHASRAAGLPAAASGLRDASEGGHLAAPEAARPGKGKGKKGERPRHATQLERLHAAAQANHAKEEAEHEAARQEAARRKEERERQAKARRDVTARMRKKTVRGQPVMKYRIEALLDKIKARV